MREAYASFAALHNDLVKQSSLRGQLDFKPPRQYGRSALPIDAVEPASEIVKRFRTGAMSYGSISMEALGMSGGPVLVIFSLGAILLLGERVLH